MAENKDNKDNNQDKNKSANEEEEEDGYTYGKCCKGYGDCIVATCRVSIYNNIMSYFI